MERGPSLWGGVGTSPSRAPRSPLPLPGAGVPRCHTNRVKGAGSGTEQRWQQRRDPGVAAPGNAEFPVTVTRGPAPGIGGQKLPRASGEGPGPCQGRGSGEGSGLCGGSRGSSVRFVPALQGLINSEQRCLHTPLTQHLANSNTAGRAPCAALPAGAGSHPAAAAEGHGEC